VVYKEYMEGTPLDEIGELLTAEQGQANLNYWISLTAAVFWCFFLLTGIALFLLRVRDPDAIRPFRVPGYPVLPLVFCAWCGFMVYASIFHSPNDSPNEALFGFVVLLAGLPLYCLPQKRRRVRTEEAAEPVVAAERSSWS
jgi:amino acid transporter